MIKKPPTAGGYSPLEGCKNTNPQWVVAPVEKKTNKYPLIIIIIISLRLSLHAVRGFCGQIYELLFVQIKRRLEHLVQQDAHVS